jgi:hypothetical protein
VPYYEEEETTLSKKKGILRAWTAVDYDPSTIIPYATAPLLRPRPVVFLLDKINSPDTFIFQEGNQGTPTKVAST